MAQSTAFTYQGKLTDAGNPANGNYDLQFKLFDALSTGAQQGATLVRNPVTASAGIFTVTLDFGANVFGGADRFLEIGVRPAGSSSAYTVLAPRQPITATPYAIQTLNAQQLGGLPANRYLNTDDSGNVGIGVTPSPGVKLDVNGPALFRPGGSGGGFAGFGTPNSETGLTIEGNGTKRADIRFDGSSLKLVATEAGIPQASSGLVITTSGDVGIGDTAPLYKLSVASPFASTLGAILGLSVNGDGVIGESPNHRGVYGTSTDGIGVQGESYDGIGVNAKSTVGFAVAGYSSTNVGVYGAGTTGVVGAANNGAKGNAAFAAEGSSWFAGDTTPLSTGVTGPGTGIVIGSVPTDFGYISAYDYSASQVRNLALNLSGGRVGIGTAVPDQTLSVNGNASKAGGGSWLSFSDERLKNIKKRFTPGLAAVMRLQPLVYQYKPDNALGLRSEGDHVGFSAQAVEKIIPEAVTRNEQGYRFVNNDPIIWTMLNAIKEQQALIEAQKKQIDKQNSINNRQQSELNAIKALVCAHHSHSAVCTQHN